MRLKKSAKLFLIFIFIIPLIGLIGYFCYVRFTKPVLTLRGDSPIYINLLDKYDDPGFNFKHPNNKLKDKVKVVNNVDTTKVGVYNVTYSMDYHGKNISIVREIIVKDNIKPIIELKGNKEMVVNQGYDYLEPGYTATDNYDGDITDKVEVINNIGEDIGTYEITYKVKDSSDNEYSTTRTIKRIVSNNGVIYLTFDDGPSSTTYKILDILKKENVKATFFVVNYGSGYDEVIKRIVSDGHTIALHSYTHNYKLIYASEEAYFDDLNKIRNRVYNTTGILSNIVRFPGGSSNTVSSFNKGIMSRLVKAVKEKGYHYFDWNSDSRDAGVARNSTEVYKNIMSGIYPNRANVVLMHDHANNNKTIDALSKLINDCKSKGYVFDKITDDTPMVVHRVNN